MELNFKLSESMTSVAEKELMSPVEYCVPVDLGIGDERLKDTYLVVGSSKFAVINKDGVCDSYEYAGMSDFAATPFVGNVILEAKQNNTGIMLCRATMGHAPRYAYIAQILNAKAKNQPERIYNDEPERRCSKCGRVLPRGSRTCPHCISKFAIFKRLFKLGSKQINIAIIATLFAFVINAISLISPRIQRILTDECLNTTNVYINPDINVFIWCLIGITGCLVISRMLEIVRGRVVAKMFPRIAGDLRDMVYKRIQQLSLRFLTSQRAGDIMNRITRDTDRICGLINDVFLQLFFYGVLLVGISVLLFITDWRMALFVLLPTPIMAYIQMKVWRKILHRLYHRQFRLDDKTNSYLHDTLSGIRVVKAFGREDAETEKFNKYTKQFADASIRSETAWCLLMPAARFVVTLASMTVIYIGATRILGGELSVGQLTEFQAYASMISGPINWIMGLPRRFADASISVDRIFGIIEEEPEITNTDDPILHKIDGDVRIENITFGYNSYEPVLKNVDLDVKKGEMIGLVGHSGAGKSTLINLISRFYDVNEGSVKVDGIDVKQYDMHDYHSQIGVVLQETFLFTGTVFDNIRFARPDATVDEVIAAAKAANAHDFIVSYPDGYDTWVNENGNNLSGGERQRLAIARAVLVDPRILILDEATSSLDIDTETSIQEALSRLTEGRTTFAIAHRLSTLRNANRLVVLDKGEVAEVGTHKELMNLKGIYYGLVMAQRRMTARK